MQVQIRNGKPAINVKIRKGIGSAKAEFIESENPSPRFWTFLDAMPDNEIHNEHEWCLEIGWERLQEIADEIFDTPVRIYSEGRSGGWAVVHGLDDEEEWTEKDRAQIEQFARDARTTADDIPYQTLSSIYYNRFQSLMEKEEKEAKVFIADLEAQTCPLVRE